MTIAALLTTILESRSVSSTYPNLLLVAMFASPNGSPYSSIERIAMPFSNMIWCCILFASICLVVYLYLCKTLNRTNNMKIKVENFSVIVVAVHSTMGGSVPIKSLHNVNRSGLIIWLLATLVLRNIYSGSLFDLLQVQLNKPPVDTIQGLIESNYKIYCSPGAYDIIFRSIPELRKQ